MNKPKIFALNSENFSKYGQIIEIPKDEKSCGQNANQGTAKRWNWLAKLVNLRAKAEPNLCLFQSSPFVGSKFCIKLLERHFYSSQAFMPLPKAPMKYLIIVCLNG
eukprot:Sdes_comp10158_c0_seq2m1774